jgi:hypothetical protein
VRASSARHGAWGRFRLRRAVRTAGTAIAIPFLLGARARSEWGAAAQALSVFTTVDRGPPDINKFCELRQNSVQFFIKDK